MSTLLGDLSVSSAAALLSPLQGRASEDIRSAVRRLAWAKFQSRKLGVESRALQALSAAVAKAKAVAFLSGAIDLQRSVSEDTLRVSFSELDVSVWLDLSFEQAIGDIEGRASSISDAARIVTQIYSPEKVRWIANAVNAQVSDRVDAELQRAKNTGEPVEVLHVAIKSIQPAIESWLDHYTNTVVRTAIATAYQRGRLEQARSPALDGFIVGWEYLSANDVNTRPNHRAAHGLMFGSENRRAAGLLSVPRGFNCRCLHRMITRTEAEERGIVSALEDGKVVAQSGRVMHEVPRVAMPTKAEIDFILDNGNEFVAFAESEPNPFGPDPFGPDPFGPDPFGPDPFGSIETPQPKKSPFGPSVDDTKDLPQSSKHIQPLTDSASPYEFDEHNRWAHTLNPDISSVHSVPEPPSLTEHPKFLGSERSFLEHVSEGPNFGLLTTFPGFIRRDQLPDLADPELHRTVFDFAQWEVATKRLGKKSILGPLFDTFSEWVDHHTEKWNEHFERAHSAIDQVVSQIKSLGERSSDHRHFFDDHYSNEHFDAHYRYKAAVKYLTGGDGSQLGSSPKFENVVFSGLGPYNIPEAIRDELTNIIERSWRYINFHLPKGIVPFDSGSKLRVAFDRNPMLPLSGNFNKGLNQILINVEPENMGLPGERLEEMSDALKTEIISIFLHEFGHKLEYENPIIKDLSKQYIFHRIRDGGLKVEHSRGSFFQYVDKFDRSYTSGMYSDGQGSSSHLFSAIEATEFMSTNLERIFGDSPIYTYEGTHSSARDTDSLKYAVYLLYLAKKQIDQESSY